MSYKAKEVYKDQEVVHDYDQKRFRSMKGRLVDWREKSLIYKALRLSGIGTSSRILDIPCGTGRLSLFLAEKGYDVLGMDISPAMVKQSRSKRKSLPGHLQVEFEVGNGESLSLPDSSFDVVISLRLFGHLPPDNRRTVLGEFSRVSKKFVIVAYYHRNSVQTVLRKGQRRDMEVAWYSVDLKQIDQELAAAHLKRQAIFFLLPWFSETVVVLAKKCKG